MAQDHTPGFMPSPVVEEPSGAGTLGGPDRPVSEVTDTVRARPSGPTRIAMVWTMLGVGLVVLAAILVFIAQNGRKAEVHFLWLQGQLPLGVALLFAVLLGAVLVLAVGGIRIVQLRRGRR